MILLNRIYSETGLFDEVRFLPGINIILGKYSGDREGRGVNGVGKSTLVRLIDFALLSKEAKEFFDIKIKTRSFLKDHNLILEFSMDNIIYKIKREFGNQKIAYFGLKGENLVEYSESELRDILGTKFFCLDEYNGYIDSAWFRRLMRFFIKDDINHHERKDPINFIDPNLRKSALLIYNFYLLGIPNSNIYEFNNLQERIEKLKSTVKELERKIEEETGKTVEEFRIEMLNMEERIIILEDSLKEFKFIDNYKDVERRLIELSNLISQKLASYNVLRRKLEDYQKSYTFELDIDVERVKELYYEINKELANFVKQTLDEVISFRKEIIENRRKFLIKRETELNKSINVILNDISKLEEERSKLYKLLQEEKALDSIINTYEQLINEKAKIERNMSSIRNIQEIERTIADLDIDKSIIISKIIDNIDGSKYRITELTSLFNNILRSAIFLDEKVEGAYFDVKASTSRRNLPVDILINVPRPDALGQSRFRILAYDLMAFFNILDTRATLPHFLIHDGVFHSISKKTVINILNYIYSQHLRYTNFQYIITANEEEIIIPPNIGDYRFDWKQMVIAKYEDIPEKTIFKREFS